MKKIMLVMATVLVAGSYVLANSTTVTSVNVVGYYQVTIPANGAALITPILEPMNDAVGTIADLLGPDALPANTRAYIWDREIKDYVSATRGARGGWGGDDPNRIILRGDAVWIVPPASEQPTTVTIMGDVPGDYNYAATTTVANISGTDAVGYAYPVSLNWTNSTLAQSLPNNSRLYIWDMDLQDYESFTKGARSGWNTPESFEIPAGTGFWVTAPEVDFPDWDQVVPYDL